MSDLALRINKQKVIPIFAPYIGVGLGSVINNFPQDVNVANPCRVATTSPLGITYTQNIPTVNSDIFSGASSVFQGVTLLNGDRILVKDETDEVHNGIYTFVSLSNIFQRSSDWNRSNTTLSPIPTKTIVAVMEGTNAGTEWSLRQAVDIVGTDPAIFTESGTSLSYTAGANISIANEVISVRNLDNTTFGTVTLVPGNEINGRILTISGTNATWEIPTGVFSVVGGTGISITGNPANPVINVIPVTAVATLTAGTGISLTGTSTNPIVNNGGVLSVTAGTNVTLAGTAANPIINVTSAGVTAGDGITVVGTQIAVDSTVVRLTGAQSLDNKILTNSPSVQATVVNTQTIQNTAGPSISFSNKRITLLAAPTIGSDAVTKAYVDNAIATGTTYLAAVKVASTVNIGATYVPGSPAGKDQFTGVGGFPSLDGIPLFNGDRILVKDQVSQFQNGIYVFNVGTTSYDRSDDWDIAVQPILINTFVFVNQGAVNTGRTYRLTATVTTVGTDPASFALALSSTTYQAGAGIDISGTTISIGNLTSIPLTGALLDGAVFGGGAPFTFSDVNSNYASGNVLTISGTQAVFAPPPGVLFTGGNGITVTPGHVIQLTVPVLPANGGTGLTSIGTNGQVLTSNGSSLFWSTPAGGGGNNLIAGQGISIVTGGGNSTISIGSMSGISLNGATIAGISISSNPGPAFNYNYLRNFGGSTAQFSGLILDGADFLGGVSFSSGNSTYTAGNVLTINGSNQAIFSPPTGGGGTSNFYVPTITSVNGYSSSVSYIWFYSVTGNIVSVFGRLDVISSAGIQSTINYGVEFNATLPIPYFASTDGGKLSGSGTATFDLPDNPVTMPHYPISIRGANPFFFGQNKAKFQFFRHDEPAPNPAGSPTFICWIHFQYWTV